MEVETSAIVAGTSEQNGDGKGDEMMESKWQSPNGTQGDGNESPKLGKKEDKNSGNKGAKKSTTDSNGNGTNAINSRVRSEKKKKKNRERSRKNVNAKRLKRELKDILLDPPAGCSGGPKSASDLSLWVATLEGPRGSPYENGRFFFEIKFPSDYPFSPPKIICKTKIYHCNFNQKGEICLDILKDNWSPALDISKTLLSIGALMDDPNPEDPLDGTIAKHYIEDKNGHDEEAKRWTQRYAQLVKKSEQK